MKYGIDSSVAFKWVVREVDSDKADRFRNAVHELLAPDVFPVEVGHALTRAERQRRIPVGTAVPLLAVGEYADAVDGRPSARTTTAWPAS